MKILGIVLLFLSYSLQAQVGGIPTYPPSSGGGNSGWTSDGTTTSTTENVVIGTTNPTLSVNTTTRRFALGQSDVEFDPITPPTAPSVALAGAGAGSVTNGTHQWIVTYVTALGESAAGTTSSTVTVVDNTVGGTVAISAIPVSSSSLVTARKIYQSKAGHNCPTIVSGSGDPVQAGVNFSTCFLLTTIGDNTTTTYTANTADASLGANPPYDTTSGTVYWGNSKVGKWDSFGLYSLNFVMSRNGAIYGDTTLVSGPGTDRPTLMHFCCAPTGGGNAFVGTRAGNFTLTTAFDNSSFGSESMAKLTTGSNNSGFGGKTFNATTTGTHGSALGREACRNVTTADGPTCVGYNAGVNVTTSANGVFLGRQADLAGATQRDNVIAIGYLATVDAADAVSIGPGVTNSVANSVNIGTNSTIYLKIPSVPGSTGKASCWKDANTMGFCSDVVGVTGGCTCN